ncbi:hypothetical protein [Nocardia seriolae]|uniref:Uncharacterized protein n=1 Tax=Nocardia seriolae TaxID=37332 RepID=A0A0B8NEG1_9NOCA|nr:hypothetical protein [Nocardia seriolae]APA96091.1 hypothetical protein NS506_02024 [Nocardia seriolae]MTJ65829.1 hypothetical protein [Nocardia seriolae]MTJ75814.1 hypothetical protein [Nocardia seriolae]MTJ86240.1 hypothetical protein [Nocardia seriolae]MTK30236.1 hypothetical protein [Nocardia seriolae]
MKVWTLSRRALALAALTATASLGATTTAIADPPKTPVENAIDQLSQAVGNDVAGKTAVANIARADQLVMAAKLENVQFTPFSYLAPTLGCGFNTPFSLTNAMAVTGVSGKNGEISLPPGNVSFQAMAQQNGFPLASGLTVAWLNVSNGRSGITALDDRTEYNLPSMSKTVDAGAGTVIASLWGTIDYPAARCVVLPTVGLFTVADTPPVQPTAPATPDAAKPDSATPTTTPATPTTPAQAPDASGNSGSGGAASTPETPAQADAGSGGPTN